MTNGSTTATFLYDGDGNRVAKTVGTVTTQYLVDDLNPTSYPQVVEELAGGVVTRQYTFGLQRISENQIVNNAWTASFYGYDGGGNVRQLTNSVGVVTDTYEYDAFGNSITKTGTTPNNYLYRAEQYDPDLGLYYLRARYYNPATGRFISRDPLDGYIDEPATLHKYLYTGGDPVNWIDPSGRADAATYALLQRFAIAAVPAVIAYKAGIVCLYGWDTTNFTSTADSGIFGGYTQQVSPCLWLWMAAKKSIPHFGPPNGTIEGPRRTRVYGPNGEPKTDYDKPHQGAPYPHVHDWPGGIREEPGRPYSPWPPENAPSTDPNPKPEPNPEHKPEPESEGNSL